MNRDSKWKAPDQLSMTPNRLTHKLFVLVG